MRVPEGHVKWTEEVLPTTEAPIPPTPPTRRLPHRIASAERRAVAAVPVRDGRPHLPERREPDEPEATWEPPVPKTWDALGLDPAVAEPILLRLMLTTPRVSGRRVANELCVALRLVQDLMDRLKERKLVTHVGTDQVGDFISQLTDEGRAKAIQSRKVTTYVGPLPVPFDQYLISVREQSLAKVAPGEAQLKRAFHDLMINDSMLDRLGPAITSSSPLFLFGDPGNGKTSIAERITRCYGVGMWIPHMLEIEGNLVSMYDPAIHKSRADAPSSRKTDRRWVHIDRPTIVAGGELTLDVLDLQVDEVTNVSESPLQLKANGGTLVIDDFGRGRTPPKAILNRWIFPLEKKTDFLQLPDGRKVAVPFACQLVFSTNLEPRDLADEAFFRRIPYKIMVGDPDPHEFGILVELLARKMGIKLTHGSVKYLVERHYRMGERPMRFCHPRDLLLQVQHLCAYKRSPMVAGPDEWDAAIASYFGLQ